MTQSSDDKLDPEAQFAASQAYEAKRLELLERRVAQLEAEIRLLRQTREFNLFSIQQYGSIHDTE